MYHATLTGETAVTLTANTGQSANHAGPSVLQVGCDLYNGTVTGGVAASLTAAQAIKNASGPSVLTPPPKRNSVRGQRSEAVPHGERLEQQGCDVHAECSGTALGLDHVLLSGGTTYQGRGWYDEVSGCLKTMPHGVMT